MSPDLVGLGALALALLGFVVWVVCWAREPEHVTAQRRRQRQVLGAERAARRRARALVRRWPAGG